MPMDAWAWPTWWRANSVSRPNGRTTARKRSSRRERSNRHNPPNLAAFPQRRGRAQSDCRPTWFGLIGPPELKEAILEEANDACKFAPERKPPSTPLANCHAGGRWAARSPFGGKSGQLGRHRCDARASPTCWQTRLVCRRNGRTKAHKSPRQTLTLPCSNTANG
jgi:hypothetical protein